MNTNWWLRPNYPSMNKNQRKGMIIFLILVVLGFGVLIANDLFASRSNVCEGVFLEKGGYIQTHRTGSQEYVTNLFFKLDSGEEVFFKKRTFGLIPNPGQRVRIYYRKGAIFNNSIYDSFELLK